MEPMKEVVVQPPQFDPFPAPPDVSTYSKLIYRDRNGMGNKTLVKELKYAPVFDESKRRKITSKKNSVQLDPPSQLKMTGLASHDYMFVTVTPNNQ